MFRTSMHIVTALALVCSQLIFPGPTAGQEAAPTKEKSAAGQAGDKVVVTKVVRDRYDREEYAKMVGFMILGTIAGESNRKNVALLKFIDSQKIRAVAEGTKLFGKYQIEKIRPNYLILKDLRSKRLIKARKNEFGVDRKKPAPKPVPKEVGMFDSFKEKGFERTRNKIEISDEYKQGILKDLSNILMQATAEAVYGPEGIEGFKMSQIDDGSIYSKSGLQNGDVVTSINGIKLDNVGATVKLLHSLKAVDELSFIIKRSGVEIPVTVDIR